MRRIKKNSSLYSYLESTGVLINGSDDEVKLQKKKYWREYKKTWKKEKLKRHKVITVSFSITEWKSINDEAKMYGMNPSRFLKRTSENYRDQRYLSPNEMQLKVITQLLAMNYNVLLQIREDEKVSKVLGNSLLEKISELENKVLIHLHHPKTLKEWIKQEMINDNTLKDHILQILAS